jgi:DNA-binding transcriptional LysR family regulator
MELYQLEYFLEAAQQPSFTQAAKRLNLAQAALSDQIRKLEQELGCALFQRNRRSNTLTAAGLVLRDQARLLLQQAQQAKRKVLDLQQLRAGRLTIAAVSSVCSTVLPRTIAAFRRKHPDIEITLHEGTSQSVAQWVEDREVDLGVAQLPTSGGPFVETLLFREPFVLLVSREHSLAKRKHVAMRDLSAERFIFYKGRARDFGQRACREAGFEPTVACESSETESIRALVVAGLGIAFLPRISTQNAGDECAVIGIKDQPVMREVAMIQRAGEPLSPSSEAFRSLLLKAFVQSRR